MLDIQFKCCNKWMVGCAVGRSEISDCTFSQSTCGAIDTTNGLDQPVVSDFSIYVLDPSIML